MQALLSTDRNRRTYPDEVEIAQPHVDVQASSTLLSAGEPYQSKVGVMVSVFAIVRSLADRYAKLKAEWIEKQGAEERHQLLTVAAEILALQRGCFPSEQAGRRASGFGHSAIRAEKD